ncbi:pentapeptide repeat-containing protein [Nakamurella sp. A5-74]|uniref:Pentapeptide repeat-containing protein n=1 Tax=Nakamurella sp. A5-74 TaxID=3158264 RepID=A0AAU8DQ75_9ACTN
MSQSLRADCARCFGLCCVVPFFGKSANFAFDKPARTPCRNLLVDSTCGIHAELRSSGMPGCTVYDCFGAGQQVSQVTFRGTDWRTDGKLAEQMFDVFPIVRELHEQLWYLEEAAAHPAAASIRAGLQDLTDHVRELTELDPVGLQQIDREGLRDRVNARLEQASSLVRGRRRKGSDRRGALLLGVSLVGADLRGFDFRGACLIAADLTGADLTGADLVGADLRDARLAGALLADALFVTQFQINAALGDAHTTLPPRLTRPDHWT